MRLFPSGSPAEFAQRTHRPRYILGDDLLEHQMRCTVGIIAEKPSAGQRIGAYIITDTIRRVCAGAEIDHHIVRSIVHRPCRQLCTCAAGCDLHVRPGFRRQPIYLAARAGHLPIGIPAYRTIECVHFLHTDRHPSVRTVRFDIKRHNRRTVRQIIGHQNVAAARLGHPDIRHGRQSRNSRHSCKRRRHRNGKSHLTHL